LEKVKQALISSRAASCQKECHFSRTMPPHIRLFITQRKLADLHFEVLKHPVYSPDLTSSDRHVFPNLERHLKGTKFSTTENAMSATDEWFAAQPSASYMNSSNNLEQRSKKCVELGGRGGGIKLNTYLCQACSSSFLQSQRLISIP